MEVKIIIITRRKPHKFRNEPIKNPEPEAPEIGLVSTQSQQILYNFCVCIKKKKETRKSVFIK